MDRNYYVAYVWKQGVRHVIVYLESGYAIHMTPADGVQITSIKHASKGRRIKWKRRVGLNVSDQEILNRAARLANNRTYSASTYNCEDFKEELLGHAPSSTTRNIILGGLFAFGLYKALKT